MKTPEPQFANGCHRKSNRRRNLVRNDCGLTRSNCHPLPAVTSTSASACSPPPPPPHPHACTERVSCQSNRRTSLERPALHPELREGGPGVVEGRVGHDGAARSLALRLTLGRLHACPARGGERERRGRMEGGSEGWSERERESCLFGDYLRKDSSQGRKSRGKKGKLL